MSSLERLTATAAPLETPSATLRGRKYGEDRLHLLVRDPRRVFVAWELSERLARQASSRATAMGAPVRYALALERSARPEEAVRETLRVDLPDAISGNGWYIDLPRGGGVCRAWLGLDLPGGFEPLLASRWMPIPPDGPCRELGDWPADPSRRDWLAREAERLRGRVAPPLPSSASRYLVSPQVPKK